MPPREPSIFISHKHVDRAIADVIRGFIDRRSNKEVAVFQSSSALAESPELGRVLTEGLKDALWKTGIVVLIYTTDDQDWQWCMWECGVATNEASPNTRIIVLQCSTEAPRVFQDQVRMNARDQNDLLKFARAFLTDASFFPDHGRALAPKLSPDGEEVRTAADELFAALAAVIPKSEVAEWAAQPLMRLEVPLEIVEQIANESGAPNIQIADVATVSSMDDRAKQIFGMAELAPATKLSGLGMRWATVARGASLDWVGDIESQLRRAARGEIPTVRWGYLREVDGSARYVPLLSRVRRIPALRRLQFDVHLIPYDDLAATRVTARMLPRSEMRCHDLEIVPLAQLTLRDLLQRLRRERLSRMPFLTKGDCVQMIVHRSTIDGYIAAKLTEGATPELMNQSLADMLVAEPASKHLFETSFKTIAQSARLSDANAIMAADHAIQDLFVTATGGPGEPVLGWITNAMIAQYAG